MNDRMGYGVVLLLMMALPLLAEDHSEYLEGPFSDVHEVTETCLACHEDAAESFLHSIHWTWGSDPAVVNRDDPAFRTGKRNVLNNFCIGLAGNEPRCTSCHAGYGWQDAGFDFNDPINIDCLVCHESTGTYQKFPTMAGYPVTETKEFSGKTFTPPALERIARSVGGPVTRQACGSCHFYGGGGNNVKHGDLEAALIDPSRDLDVHMGGADMLCVDCHETYDHQIPGQAMSVTPHNSKTLTCENCHGETPHEKYAYYLDRHSESLACQTCHIPEFARANPTKMSWDWSQAGDKDREVRMDAHGMPDYAVQKGAFTWGKDVIPVYRWYNGESQRMLLGDPIDPEKVNVLSSPKGEKGDTAAKIFPYKVHKGRQIADRKHRYLLPTHVYGGYWKHFDWDQAVRVGAEAYGMEYSGRTVFVETEMYWEIDHMVAPKEHALHCGDCHSRKGKGRMDWQVLGYEGDPRYNPGLSRTPMR